jgi:hypothetical protein
MAFSTDWKPSVGGKKLGRFKAYDAMVEEDARPYSREYPDWAAKTIQPQVGAVPDAAPAIQESVLGLWRLKMLEKDLEDATDGFVSDWQQFVSAWLVSR